MTTTSIGSNFNGIGGNFKGKSYGREAQVIQADYYFSSSGSDTNDGKTPTTPKQTITALNALSLEAGDVVALKRGDSFEGAISITDSGTSGNPIKLTSYGVGNRPKIIGSDLISGWTVHSGNIYKKVLTDDIRQLYIDDEIATLARYPKTGYADITTVNTTTQFISTDITSEALDYYKDALWVGKTNSYTITKQTVTTSTGQTITLNAAPAIGLAVDRGFFLTNKLEFLTAAGEWYYDSSTKTVYAWMPNSDSPDNYTIRGSVESYGVQLNANDYITIENLEITQFKTAGIGLGNIANDITIFNCNINSIDGRGIYAPYGTNDFSVKNCILSKLYQAGIFINNGDDYVIHNNTISDVGLLENVGLSGSTSNTGFGIETLAGDADIYNNTITDVGYCGIYSNTGLLSVTYNTITRALKEQTDGGGFYSFTANYEDTGITGSTIANNTFNDIVTSTDGDPAKFIQSYAIYFDGKVNGVECVNNIMNTCDAGFNLNGGGEHDINNNTSTDCGIFVNSSSQVQPSTVENNTVSITDRSIVVVSIGTVKTMIVNQTGTADNDYDYNTYTAPNPETNTFRNIGGWTDWKADGNDANSTMNGAS